MTWPCHFRLLFLFCSLCLVFVFVLARFLSCLVPDVVVLVLSCLVFALSCLGSSWSSLSCLCLMFVFLLCCCFGRLVVVWAHFWWSWGLFGVILTRFGGLKSFLGACWGRLMVQLGTSKIASRFEAQKGSKKDPSWQPQKAPKQSPKRPIIKQKTVSKNNHMLKCS